MEPADTRVAAGATVTLTCLEAAGSSSGDKTKRFTFLLADKVLVDSAENSFTIDSANKADNGAYTCKVKIDGAQSLPSNIQTLTVAGECAFNNQCAVKLTFIFYTQRQSTLKYLNAHK